MTTEHPVPFDARQLHTMIEALPLAVSWARLEDGVILFMNRKFTELFGYGPGDFRTVQEWVDKAYVYAEHRQRAMEQWYPYFGAALDEPREIPPVEVDVQCKDGTVRTCLLHGVILPEAGWAVASFVDVTERKRQEAMVQALADHDPLTDLINRRVFDGYLNHYVERARGGRGPAHLLLLDLDHFKDVNDRFGHQAGDQVLIEVAERLRDCIRASDVLARFGGDEFGIILADAGDREAVDQVCAKILAAIHKPFEWEGHQLQVGVSIGIALAPDDAEDAAALFREADHALYRSKHTGRNRWTHASELQS